MATIAKPKRKTCRNAPKTAKTSTASQASPGKTSGAQTVRGELREGTKLAAIVSLLSRDEGASIVEIMEVTGWQHHSVRGAISGMIKKKLSLSVTSTKDDDRGRVYRITAAL